MGSEDNNIVKTIVVAAGAGLAAWGLSMLFGSAPGKKMKAPGQDYKIYRDDFERDPAKWFRDHRK